ncbi:MAG: aldo/keto reductase [Pseudomonadota bacterium]|jgi:Predicted oxidoreductases (related to aryl-alcohol dehydrogenases)|nr:MAG: alcohol dehydrogenase [Pseudomonadota bacterium]
MSDRQLGTSGLATPPLVLGGNVFGWTADEKTSHAILDAFVAGGGKMIDTADVYSTWVPGHKGGESETIIGTWLAARGRRDDVLIATKVGMEIGGEKGLAPARIEAAVEGSLRRLRTDYIDLYYAHVDDADTPLEETLAAFDRLVRAGKVRAIGASNYEAPRLEQALDISARRGFASYTVLQPRYNLMDRSQFEGPLQQLCVERNIAALPYFGLASGFLTGKYRSDKDLEGRARARAVAQYMNERGFAVLNALDEVAAEARATPAQVALAWLAAQPGVAAPIASATSVAQTEELLGAMRLVLTKEQLARLDAASRPA